MQSAQQQQHPSHPQMYAQGQISSGPYINNQMLGKLQSSSLTKKIIQFFTISISASYISCDNLFPENKSMIYRIA